MKQPSYGVVLDQAVKEPGFERHGAIGPLGDGEEEVPGGVEVPLGPEEFQHAEIALGCERAAFLLGPDEEIQGFPGSFEEADGVDNGGLGESGERGLGFR